jgi:Ca2+-binding RTX toxin-like protein
VKNSTGVVRAVHGGAVVLTLIGAGSIAGPAPAHAEPERRATVSGGGSGVSINSWGVARGDKLVIRQSGGTFTVTDVVPLEPRSGCVAVDLYEVTCTTTDPHPFLSISLSSFDDIVRNETTSPSYIHTFGGDDVVTGGPATDRIDGGFGNDKVSGGGGDDRLYAAAGTDVLSGGPGWDVADYRHATGPVTADLDGAQGDDGGAGEGDTIMSDVEGLTGGTGNDTLSGNDRDNDLWGNEGADRIFGGGGNDDLEAGDSWDDVLDGGAGDDYCWSWYDPTTDCERWEPNRPKTED